MTPATPEPEFESVEYAWHAARLISTLGIRNDEEREKRATSALP
jgi:hypothetical protein